MTARRTRVPHWHTVEEWGYDAPTGAIVRVRERLRRAGDRPGKSDTVWGWQVQVNQAMLASGTTNSQQGARAAIRRFLVTLPNRIEIDGEKPKAPA
jgi:hypothetical protein